MVRTVGALREQWRDSKGRAEAPEDAVAEIRRCQKVACGVGDARSFGTLHQLASQVSILPV